MADRYLPAWAKLEMQRKDRRIESLEREVAELRANEDRDTDVMAVDNHGTRYPLPAGVRVRFGCTNITDDENRDYGDYVFEVIPTSDGELEIRSRDGRLAFLPNSSNVAYVRNDDLFGRKRS